MIRIRMEQNFKEVRDQWIPHPLSWYKEFEVLFDKISSMTQAHGTTTVDGEQIYIPKDNFEYNQIQNRFFEWLEQQFKFKNMHNS